jgi:hypothetical protein
MSDILDQAQALWDYLQHAAGSLHGVHVNPWVAAIMAGLIAAFWEQRRAARRAAPFTEDHINAAGHPGGPR